MMTLDEIAQAEARAAGVVEPLSDNAQIVCWDDVPALAATARTAIELLQRIDQGDSQEEIDSVLADTKAFLAQVGKGGA